MPMSDSENTRGQPDKEEVERRIQELTPQGLGAQLLERYGDQILIVSVGKGGVSGWRTVGKRMWGKPTAYWLHESGRWDATSQPWMDHLEKILADLERAARLVLKKGIDKAVWRIHAARKNKSLADDVRLHLRSVLLEVRDRHPEAFDVEMCTVDELDLDLRYLGCKNCVVDLQEGVRLQPSEGRKHFVTYSTGVDFDEKARHADVDRLFSHLGETERGWFWTAMGQALHGRPDRRLYLVVGERGGGKSRMAQALTGSLGEYAAQPMDSALMESGGQGSHNTELSAFARPVRVCVMDEVATPRSKVSAAVLKRVTGGADITFRRLYENAVTLQATATLFLICNPDSVPNLHTQDQAIQDRLRELTYPPVPEEKRDPDLVERIRSPEFRQAFLVRLVAEASAIKPGHHPDDIPTVKEATQARIEEGIGEFGRFARRIQPSKDRKLPVEEIWQAWCELHDVNLNPQHEEARKKGVHGITRVGLVSRLRKFVRLPEVKTIRVDGKPVRGFVGWKLLAEPKAGSVASLPADASLAEAVLADERLGEGSGVVRRQIRRRWRWAEHHIEGPQAANSAQIIRDGEGNVQAVEPRFWPRPDGDHRLEARYLQTQLLKMRAGKHPWPKALEYRVARWLCWVSYGEELHATLEEFAQRAAGEVLVLLNEGARASALEERNIEELLEALSSHNRSRAECARRVKRVAGQVCRPPRRWGVCVLDLSGLMAVPEDPTSPEIEELQKSMLERIEELDGEEPLAVGATPAEALNLAATKLKQESLRSLSWLLLGGSDELDGPIDGKALAKRLTGRFSTGAMNVRVDVDEL